MNGHRQRSRNLAAVVAGLLCANFMFAGPTSAQSRPQDLPVVIWFDDHNEVLSGRVTRYDFLQPRSIDVRTHVGEARCIGQAEPHLMPLDAEPPGRCDGIQGLAELSCSDGRQFRARWSLDPDCSSGYGKGADQDGNTVHLTFGGSPDRVAAAVREAVAAGADRPPPPAPGDAERTGGVSSGTAFFIGWDGLLMTNHHVIDGMTKIEVLLDDGELVPAAIIATNEEDDLAVLRVPAIRRPIPLLRGHALDRGDEVMVLGFPLVNLQGTDQKATFGRVNALSGIQGDERYLQMDAAIQPGNSGGPLINRSGEVVGVVTSMLSQMATMRMAGVVPQNVNYALKSDFAHRQLRRSIDPEWKTEGEALVEPEAWADVVRAMEASVVLVIAQ